MKKRTMLAFLATMLVMMLALPTMAFADPSWTDVYGKTINGDHVQETLTGTISNNPDNTNSSTPSQPTNNSGGGSNKGGGGGSSTPGSVTPPVDPVQEALKLGIASGVKAVKEVASIGGFQPGQEGAVYKHIDIPGTPGTSTPGWSTQCVTCDVAVQSQYQTSVTGLTLFSFVPTKWDWSFSNDDYPAGNYTVTLGPMGSMSQSFAHSGYWHVYYRVFGTFTYGHYNVITITTTSSYNGQSYTSSYTVSIPVVDKVFDDYNGGWNHLTDFRLNDWELGKPWGVPDVGQRQVELGVGTAQVVAK